MLCSLSPSENTLVLHLEIPFILEWHYRKQWEEKGNRDVCGAGTHCPNELRVTRTDFPSPLMQTCSGP